jgi:hypothetical protein
VIRLGIIFFLGSCLLPLCQSSLAGDAVAIGLDGDHVWTSVTYYSSGTPKGGRDYKTEKAAREEALRDLHKRGGNETVHWDILSSSDLTGFVAVGRASAYGKDVNVVGRGETQAEADEKAMAELNQRGATNNQKVVYRYFSHGSDGK